MGYWFYREGDLFIVGQHILLNNIEIRNNIFNHRLLRLYIFYKVLIKHNNNTQQT